MDGWERKVNEFFKYLPAFHPIIKFTIEKSLNNIIFLDITVSKRSNKLTTDLHTKETDIHQYFLAKSCHRSFIKRAIQYVQAVLITPICSDGRVLKERLTQFQTWFLEMGYLQENVRPGNRESKSNFKGRSTFKVRKFF